MNRLFFWILTLSLIGAGAPALGATAFEKRGPFRSSGRSGKACGLPKRDGANRPYLRPSDPALFRRAKVLTSLVLPPGENGKAQLLPRSVYPPGRQDIRKYAVGDGPYRSPGPYPGHNTRHHRGTLLSEEDIEFKLLPMGRATLPRERVIGSVATRELKAGERIAKTSVRAPMIVQRGDVVQAVLQRSSFSLQTKIEVMGRGSVGDTVHAKLLQTGKVVRARIDSPEVIRLLL